jgi:hypothetical protein
MRHSLLLLLFTACATTSGSTGSGSSELNRLLSVCWPAGSASPATVTLDFSHAGDVGFETSGGASNSTARCMREIALSFPPQERPGGQLAVQPGEPADGWTILDWVKRVSVPVAGNPSLTDPAPLIAGCLGLHGGIRDRLKPAVSFEPALQTYLALNDVHGSPATDTERCVLAVLGSTRWPATRPYALALPTGEAKEIAHQPDAAAVALYDSATNFTGPLRDPLQVKSAFGAVLPKVSACWEEAISRRAGLVGGRTVMLQVDETGKQLKAAIAPLMGEGLEVNDYLLDRCLVAAASGAKLPPGERGRALYSWVFAER